MTVRCALVALGCCLTAACNSGDQPLNDFQGKKELEKLQGTWSVKSFRHGGQDVIGTAQESTLLIQAETWSLRIGGASGDLTYRLKLEPSRQPKEFDLVSPSGNAPGIYAFDGAELKFCWARIGQARPTGFGTTSRDERFTLVAKRTN